ncbi:glucokinase [Spirillospora sp. CA-294931]|uniref:glucokinase n=1 Tax=Spirillospora sp. CA-294931 TaxID=3240042 RepID=UPI003D8E2CC8
MSVCLVADVGGTNARFALVDEPGAAPRRVRTLATREHAGLAEAAAAYLRHHAADVRVDAACLAVAGPVGGGRFHLTNAGWARDSAERVRDRLGLPRLEVINDFAALAWALPLLAPEDLMPLGGPVPSPDGSAPLAVLGPGTGLGVAGLVPAADGGWIPISGEGGHVDLPAGTEREIEVMRLLRAERGAAGAESLLSGEGLARIHRLLALIHGVPPVPLGPGEICARRDDPVCAEAVAMFCALLGAFAGNVALTLGAWGGVYLGGGILPRIAGDLARSDFRRRFEDKPPIEGYVRPVPTALIVHDRPGLLGASARLAARTLEPA